MAALFPMLVAGATLELRAPGAARDPDVLAARDRARRFAAAFGFTLARGGRRAFPVLLRVVFAIGKLAVGEVE